MVGKRRRPSGTSAIPWPQSSWAGTEARSRPSRRTRPPRIGKRPAIASMSVVLPAPFGPTTVTSSRAPTTSETSQTATASPWATSRRSTSSIGLAEIRADHVRIAHHLPRKALGDDPAAAQDDHAIGEVQDRPHDVLDEDDGGAALPDATNETERVGHLRGRQTREHFVEQHEPRLGGERAREIEKLPLEQVQLAGQRAGLGFEA